MIWELFLRKNKHWCCWTCTKFLSFCEVIFIFSCILSSRLWRTFLRNTLYQFRHSLRMVAWHENEKNKTSQRRFRISHLTFLAARLPTFSFPDSRIFFRVQSVHAKSQAKIWASVTTTITLILFLSRTLRRDRVLKGISFHQIRSLSGVQRRFFFF